MSESQYYSQVKTKIIQARKNEVKCKLSSIDSIYKETLAIFENRLEDIVSEVLKTVNVLLEENNDNAFLQSVNDVENTMEKCRQKLYDVNLAFSLHCMKDDDECVLIDVQTSSKSKPPDVTIQGNSAIFDSETHKLTEDFNELSLQRNETHRVFSVENLDKQFQFSTESRNPTNQQRSDKKSENEYLVLYSNCASNSNMVQQNNNQAPNVLMYSDEVLSSLNFSNIPPTTIQSKSVNHSNQAFNLVEIDSRLSSIEDNNNTSAIEKNNILGTPSQDQDFFSCLDSGGSLPEPISPTQVVPSPKKNEVSSSLVNFDFILGFPFDEHVSLAPAEDCDSMVVLSDDNCAELGNFNNCNEMASDGTSSIVEEYFARSSHDFTANSYRNGQKMNKSPSSQHVSTSVKTCKMESNNKCAILSPGKKVSAKPPRKLSELEKNIEVEGTKELALITDIVSPSLFSIQLEASLDALAEFETQLNEFYSQMWIDKLQFKSVPKVGTICVAYITMVDSWYRVKILGKGKSRSIIKVRFIDYGNCDEVNLNRLRQITCDEFKDAPQYAISCFLDRVEPVDADKIWSNSANARFYEAVFGSFCSVEFKCVDPKIDMNYSCEKYPVEVITEENRNVACDLVSLNFAKPREKGRSNTKRLDTNNNELSPILSHSVVGTSHVISQPSSNRVDKSGGHTSQKHEKSVILSKCSSSDVVQRNRRHISAMESSISDWANANKNGEMETRNKEQKRDDKAKREKASLTYTQCLEAQRNSSVEVFEAMNMKTWDPMVKDFSSDRNHYSIDVDNACVAVENINYDEIRLCKYYLKGDCWSGKDCNYSHHEPGSGVIHSTTALSFNNIPSVDFVGPTFVYVKVLKMNRVNRSIYVQILRNLSADESHANLNDDLETVKSDLADYYSVWLTKNHGRGLLDEHAAGEIKVILHERVYSRVKILAKSFNSSDRYQVFLIDYGYTLWVCGAKLYPFHEAFMHLPAQAILCTLSDRSPIKPKKYVNFTATIYGADDLADSPNEIILRQKF